MYLYLNLHLYFEMGVCGGSVFAEIVVATANVPNRRFWFANSLSVMF